MKLTNLFYLFFALIAFFLIVLGFFAFLMLKNQINLENSQDYRFRSNAFALELRKSSDDLTACCRTFVQTGDTVWENKYWEVLDIRNGKKARPDGNAISLLDTMQKIGYSKAEFDKLKEAERFSNELVFTEKAAFNAVRGIFADSAGNFTITGEPDTAWARNILFDKEYHAKKSKITDPLNDFFKMQDERISNNVDKLKRRGFTLLSVIIALILIIAAFVFVSFIILSKKIVFKLNELRIAYEKIEEADRELKKQNEELDRQVEIIKMANTLATEHNQKLNELNASKDKFFSIIAHDLRGLLGVLVSYSGLVLENDDITDPAELKEHIKNLYDTSSHVNELLSNLLTWARSQTSEIKVNPVEINIGELITTQINILAPISTDKKISISLSGKTDTNIKADKNQVEFIMRNLLSNAMKFSPRNGKIDVIVIPAPIKDYSVRIVVKDYGVGMSPDVVKNLFSISETQVSVGTDGERGTGLGLILCKEFIDKNRGAITVESTPGKGSSFIVDLP